MNTDFGTAVIAQARNVLRQLSFARYRFDDFQRGFVWGRTEVLELVNNLTDCFFNEYRPDHDFEEIHNYSIYFLGDIVTQDKGTYKYVIDGQQRLTSLTLLLIVLRNMRIELGVKYNIDITKLIFSERYGKEAFNLDVEERKSCMEALYNNKKFDTTGQSSSVVKLYNRYNDIRKNWPAKLTKKVLPYFVEWLLRRVYIVETSTNSTSVAFSVYEARNNRGLPVSHTDLLRAYMIANIRSKQQAGIAANVWDEVISSLREFKKGQDEEFIMTWLRSKFSQSMSIEKTESDMDFERIGAEFHHWVCTESEKIGLRTSDDYFRVIERDFRFFSDQYLKVKEASKKKIPKLESIHYNSKLGASLQCMVLLAPLTPNDSESLIVRKLQRTAKFIEMLIVRRLWHGKSITSTKLQRLMFKIVKDIRNMDLKQLDRYFVKYLKNIEQIEDNGRIFVDGSNSKSIQWLLARMTEYVEIGSGLESRFDEYLKNGPKGFTLEQICPDVGELLRYERYVDTADATYVKGCLGGLVLLSNSANSNTEMHSFKDKLKYYKSENLLAWSLSEDCYEENPKFLEFVKDSNLPFRPYSHFGYNEILERSRLYCEIANKIWSPDNLKSWG